MRVLPALPRFRPFLPVLACVLVLCGATSGAAKPDFDAIIASFNQAPRAVRSEGPLPPVRYVELDGVAYGYMLPRRLVRLAEGGATFSIAKVKAHKDHLLLKLTTPSSAVLEVRVFGRTRLPDEKRAAVLDLVLRSLFDCGAKPLQSAFVGNTQSRLAHLGSCNHLPESAQRVELASLETAGAEGYRPCPACFAIGSFVLMEGYGPARMSALENSRVFEIIFPPAEDPELQKRLDEAATRVLDGYPLDLLGFEYAFKVVHSSVMQAYALPTGFVYVTDQLMASLESEAELEFVLAHEIAHCELHLPPNAPAYRDAMGLLINPLSMTERAADVLAMECLRSMGRPVDCAKDVRRILAKLEFANQLVPLANDPRWTAERYLAERLSLFDDQQYRPAPDLIPLQTNRPSGDLEARLLGWSRGEKRAGVFVVLSGTDLLDKSITLSKLGAYEAVSGSGAKYAMKPTWSCEIAAETSLVLEYEGPLQMYEDLSATGLASLSLRRQEEKANLLR